MSILPVGSDVCLPLRTVCEYEAPFPIGSDMCLTLRVICVGEAFVGLCISHPLRGFVTVLSSDV